MPEQDLRINLTRIPAIPNSLVVIRSVRRAAEGAARRLFGSDVT